MQVSQIEQWSIISYVINQDKDALKLKIQRRKAENTWQKANVSQTKSNTYRPTNVTSDTYILLKRKL